MNNTKPLIKPKTGSRAKLQVRAKDGTFSAKLTRKQKAFADKLLDQPKASATEIARQTYNVTDNATAAVIAAENLRKPNIMLYIDGHVTRARDRIVDLIDAEKEEIQLRASQDILDRTHGKPTQHTEVKSTRITISLSGN